MCECQVDQNGHCCCCCVDHTSGNYILAAEFVFGLLIFAFGVSLYVLYANSIFGCGNVYSDAYGCITGCGLFSCYELSDGGKAGFVLGIVGGILCCISSASGIYGIHIKNVAALNGVKILQISLSVLTFIYFWISLSISASSIFSGISQYTWPYTIFIAISFILSLYAAHSIRIQIMVFNNIFVVGTGFINSVVIQPVVMGQPMYAQPPMAQPMYGQPPMGQPMYGQPPMGQPMYGQPPMGQPYGQPPMGQQYPQQTYNQPPMGQPMYGQPPQQTYNQPPMGQSTSNQPPQQTQ